VTGPHDSDLPPGRLRRGRYLLAGKIPADTCHPYEVAYATAHIIRHPSLEADAWRRTREDQALAELRASLGAAPWVHFGEAALRALVAAGGTGECVRCRANMIAKVRRLSPPGYDPETSWLVGPGCERCRSVQTRTVRPDGGARPIRPTPRPPAGSRGLAALREDVRRLVEQTHPSLR
jgi:hypothetical protein